MHERLRCLIVDDEPLAREALRGCALDFPELEIVGEAADGPEAVNAIGRLSPDLVFLDVQMPEGGGFDVLRALEQNNIPVPAIIFVTAFDQYALQAFESHALDYLLKPIDERRFRRAVLNARERIASTRDRSTAEQLANLLSDQVLLPAASRISVKSKGRILFLRLDEIYWIEAQGNYIRLHLKDESHLLRETMTSFEGRLDPERFMRIHRSTMVNIDHIKDIQPWFTGEYIVRMENGKELTLTRSYRNNLKRLLGEEEL